MYFIVANDDVSNESNALLDDAELFGKYLSLVSSDRVLEYNPFCKSKLYIGNGK